MKTKLLLSIILGIFFISLVCAADVSYCCERTVVQSDGSGGAWCDNQPAENCDDDYRKAPTSCESTSYCKRGTCIDSTEGTCMENSPQKVCEDAEGIWYDSDADDLAQCDLGCCLIGEQAAFVTQTRCKRLSALYGLETDFRTDISNEVQCIATAKSDVKGACVFEKEFETTCLFISQEECSGLTGNVSFHEGYLCSDESLGTNCGPGKKTTCVEGKDHVYFVDTCGNLANVYDASKVNNKEYWSKAKDVSESCNYGDSNADSAACGNCDYYLGSTCKAYKSSVDKNPTYGDYVCRDLSCEYEGKRYEHGETWCADSDGAEENLPGSRHFRLICYNGEVSVEPCADYRQEVCIESDIEGFSTAACRANEWQDCVFQDNKKDCENADRRDCEWVSSSWKPKEGDYGGIIQGAGACVPKYAPGFDFWEAEGSSEDICTTASARCVVVFEKNIFGKRECVKNCECLTSSWKNNLNEMCTALGDCGSKTNFIGVKGYHDEDAYYSGADNEEENSEDE